MTISLRRARLLATRVMEVFPSALHAWLIMTGALSTALLAVVAYSQWTTIHNTALSTLTNQSSLLAVGVDGFLDNYKIAARGLDSYLQA
ncbi:MAG: hypothetical protein ACYDEV_12745, partial [Acidiferrobacter sp.]